MKHLFLSGGNGFIGRHVIEQLQDNYKIAAPGRLQLELTDPKQVDAYFAGQNFACIIHGASVGVSRNAKLAPLVALNANLRAFATVFQHRASAPRFIHLGSGAEYGRPLARRQIEESQLGRVIPDDEYGFAKLLATKMLESEPPQKAVSLQLFGVFGPYEDYQTRFISNAIVRTLFNLPITLKQNLEFSYVYINDFIKILQQFIERPADYSSYNIVTGQPVELLEIAELVREIMGNKTDIIVQQSGMGHAYTGDGQRLQSFLAPGFCFTPLKAAIEELVVWYEKRVARLDLAV